MSNKFIEIHAQLKVYEAMKFFQLAIELKIFNDNMSCFWPRTKLGLNWINENIWASNY